VPGPPVAVDQLRVVHRVIESIPKRHAVLQREGSLRQLVSVVGLVAEYFLRGVVWPLRMMIIRLSRCGTAKVSWRWPRSRPRSIAWCGLARPGPRSRYRSRHRDRPARPARGVDSGSRSVTSTSVGARTGEPRSVPGCPGPWSPADQAALGACGVRSVAGWLGMNPETLRTWFRPVEVNSHRAEGVASPRPTAPAQRSGIDHRRMGNWQDTRRSA